MTGAAIWLALAALHASSAAATAPDHGRVWEHVTSGAANGVPLVQARAWSPEGDRVVFASIGPMPGAPSGELFSHSLAVRTPGGWRHEGIGQPIGVGTVQVLGSLPLAVSSDLTAWVWGSIFPLLPGGPAEPSMGMYRRGVDGGLTLVGDLGPAEPGFALFGASADMGHVAFEARNALVAADSGRISGRAAYELAGDELRLVGVDDAGAPLSVCGSVLGNGSFDFITTSFEPVLSPNAISRDGSRVFFTSPDPNAAACGDQQRVYLREGGVDTTEISASQCHRADCNGPADIRFAGARDDGASALLVTTQQLTDDDQDDGADIYRYEVAGGAMSRLTTGPPGVPARVHGFVVRSSEDGDRVYFIAEGQLVPGEGEDGGENLYLWDQGDIRFVGAVDAGATGGIRFASTTPDGGVLLFSTHAQLLASDTDASADVYRYEAATDSLTHVSLGAAGAGNDAHDARLPVVEVALLPDQTLRSLTEDGERAFFTTTEGLVPEDSNGGVDVYEWADGRVGLVSSGRSASRLLYGGASADGRSVFLLTDEGLLGSDRDGGDLDLYAARLGGGFSQPGGPSAACEGDVCQGKPRPRRKRPTPATLLEDAGSSAELGRPRVGTRARRRLANTGRASLYVLVPGPGRLSLTARARIGGRWRVVARDQSVAKGRGMARLRLRLSAVARRSLARGVGRLRLRLVIRHSLVDEAGQAVLTLRRPS